MAGRSLAQAGCTVGLFFVVLLGMLRFGVDDEPDRANPLGVLALLIAYAAPFVVSLVAFDLDNARRAALWLAGGVLAFLLSFTALSGVSLVLLPAAVLLQLAAWRAYRAAGGQSTWPILPLALGIVAVGVAAFVVLTVNEDPRCWALVRSPGGEEVWETRPVSSTLSTDDRVRAMTCTSDVITSAEGAASLGLWLGGAVGLFASLHLWGPPPRTAAIRTGGGQP